MSRSIRTRVKSAVAKSTPDNTRLDVIANLSKLETWRKNFVSAKCPVFDDRESLYRHLNDDVIGDNPIDFLEFGVYEGESIEFWAGLNRSRDSRFFGFDTFTGLPEDWDKFSRDMPKDAFDCGGATPETSDTRVYFVKGMFQDTLADFLADFEPSGQLLLHNDSDLYSSTLFVLTACDKFLVPGSIVVFDEFSSVLNEFRALRDYCAAYRRSYEVIGVTADYFAQVAIRFV